MTSVLSFDIGIRNLAWCVLEKAEGASWTVRGWQNYDLIEEVGVDAKKKAKCHACSAKPRFSGILSGAAYESCPKHCPPSRPAIRDASGNLMLGLPGMKVLKDILAIKGLKKTSTMVKDDVVAAIQEFYSLPIIIKKKKSTEYDLSRIHDSIRTLVTANQALFASCKEILLENQPVLKNPTMKTVQILLFATLRDILQPSPPALALVHAGKKAKGEAAGDAGYKARKAASEQRVVDFLQKQNVVDKGKWTAFFAEQKKKSDLADALSMSLDRLS
jgi:hypothetical protein